MVYGEGSVAHLAITPDALTQLRRSPLGWNQPVRLAVEGAELALLGIDGDGDLDGAGSRVDHRADAQHLPH